jgi:hypothetical protein
MARQQAGRVGNGTVGEQTHIIQRETQESLHGRGEIVSCTIRRRGHVYWCVPTTHRLLFAGIMT